MDQKINSDYQQVLGAVYLSTPRLEHFELEEDFCTEINLPLGDILPVIYQELQNNMYYKSSMQMIRADASPELRSKLQELIGIPLWCCGFHKNPPGWAYKLHTDIYRRSVINILLAEENQDFDASFLVPPRNFVTIPYRTNVPLLMNVKKPHYVKNNSKTDTRYIMSIGFDKLYYAEAKEILYSKYPPKGKHA